jgi:peptidoglycan hydrolase-like protein with peptidoglycan-binding domain
LCATGVLHADQTIRSLQQILKDKGLYYGAVTGEKSAETSAAIRRYQIRNGLKVTGEVNEETSRSLSSSTNSVAAVSKSSTKPATTQPTGIPPNAGSLLTHNSPPSSSGQSEVSATNPSYLTSFYHSTPARMNRRIIAEAQYQLTSRGYYRGRIDGTYGSRTAFAVRAFQSSAGVPPTGQLDVQTLNALGSSNPEVANFTPASRHNESWLPVTKFKDGKWKVKWKRYDRPWGGERGDEDQQANNEYDFNGYNEN